MASHFYAQKSRSAKNHLHGGEAHLQPLPNVKTRETYLHIHTHTQMYITSFKIHTLGIGWPRAKADDTCLGVNQRPHG